MKQVIGNHFYVIHCPVCGTSYKYDHAELKNNTGNLVEGRWTKFIDCPKCKTKNRHSDSVIRVEEEVLKG